jgi:hypothetical protein
VNWNKAIKAGLYLFILFSLVLIADILLPLKQANDKVTFIDETRYYTRKHVSSRLYWIRTNKYVFNIDPDVWEDTKIGDSFSVNYSPIFKVVHTSREIYPVKTEWSETAYKLNYAFYIIPVLVLLACVIALFYTENYNLVTGLIIAIVLSWVLVANAMPSIWGT